MATVAAAPHAVYSSGPDPSSSEEDDELMFGDFCFTCGNATQGIPYCSQQCRHSDSLNALPSPDFSLALSAVPPLISSAKSVSSTPPSSANNSPSPFTTPLSEAAGADPPQLDLPALASKFDYGGASLPVGLRYPTHFSHSYSHDLVSYPSKELKATSFGAGGGGFDPLDLTYRRRPGVPTQTIPAPLYFRQTAAVHSSPALGPSSPRFSPRFSPSHGPTLSNLTNVSTFALPPAVATVSAPPTLPPTPDCGRPGCAGRIELKAGAGSRPSSLSGTKRPAPLDADLLLSPRIRALRGGEVASIGGEEGVAEGEPVDGNHHSAFACYLFSHLTEPTPPLPSTDSSRGRSIRTAPAAPQEKRSASADSAYPHRGPTPATHPPRFAFGGRALPTPERLELSSTPAKPKLTPGRFIAATTDSPTPSTFASPIPSPPASPPTLANRGRPSSRRSEASPPTLANRGRPSSRRSEASPPAFVGPTPDPRGRSKMRGIGAVQRDFSPVRDPSNSTSRGREAEVSKERGRGSRSRARSPRQSSRRSEGEESRRGRAKREEIEEEGEEVYRRGRSTSALRKGRGREVALSGAGYGHYESP